MSKVKVLIVEDELIIAEDIKQMLMNINYEIAGVAVNSEGANKIISLNCPDVALIDIRLEGNEDGVLLAGTIKDKYNMPVIFITSYADKDTVERAKHVHPDGYLVKPFVENDLYSTMEIALFNHSAKESRKDSLSNDKKSNGVLKDNIFIRKDGTMVKIRLEELMWIKADTNYLELYCLGNKYLIRSTLKEFITQLPDSSFLQVHKSYCINASFLTAIDHSYVWLKDVRIPVGRSYLRSVYRALNIDM